MSEPRELDAWDYQTIEAEQRADHAREMRRSGRAKSNTGSLPPVAGGDVAAPSPAKHPEAQR